MPLLPLAPPPGKSSFSTPSRSAQVTMKTSAHVPARTTSYTSSPSSGSCSSPSCHLQTCLGGWACFITNFIVIGVLTGLLSDLVFRLGCTVGLKDSVTAFLLVPIGINAPDIFAIKIAAQNDKYADSSIGNVMCNIPVNAFLSIGLSWSIVALYHAYFNRAFKIQPGTLSFASTLFSACAFVCSIVLLLRRTSLIGGELGGPMLYKISTVILFVGLWFFFVIASILEAYEFIQGF